jgi:hypothetical protein
MFNECRVVGEYQETQLVNRTSVLILRSLADYGEEVSKLESRVDEGRALHDN